MTQKILFRILKKNLQIKFPHLETALYLVSTPIGTAADFTYRGVHVLSNADILLAEDTRVLKKLLKIFDIGINNRPVRSYNDNSSPHERAKCIDDLDGNKSIAYCCDAGTPLISDPGYKLVKEVIDRGYKVRAIPGASSVLVALCQSGLPSDRFCFGGFAPSRQTHRRDFLREFSLIPATLIFYESPKRIVETLEDLQEIFGEDHIIAVCRELTKLHEDNKRGTITDLITQFKQNKNLRGELTILVSRKKFSEPDENLITTELTSELTRSSLRDATTKLADKYSLSKKYIYAMGLKILKN